MLIYSATSMDSSAGFLKVKSLSCGHKMALYYSQFIFSFIRDAFTASSYYQDKCGGRRRIMLSSPVRNNFREIDVIASDMSSEIKMFRGDELYYGICYYESPRKNALYPTRSMLKSTYFSSQIASQPSVHRLTTPISHFQAKWLLPTFGGEMKEITNEMSFRINVI